MNTKLKQGLGKRRGVAMAMVLLMGIVLLVLGMAMIVTSGGLLQSTVDSKQRIRSRFAAEAMVELQIAKLDKLKDSLLGSNLNLSAGSTDFLSPTGENGKVDPVKVSNPKGQELITDGDFKGMQGIRVPFMIHATGLAPGGAKTKIDASIYLFQVPLFQFGVFYQGNLEITPGPSMTVFGPAHTNGNAYFRAARMGAAQEVAFQGPVTVAGTLFHWLPATATPGILRYYNTPDMLQGSLSPSTLGYTIRPALTSELPIPVGGVSNIAQGTPSLNLPIGGAQPHDLITVCDGTEPASLRKQKFDCMIRSGSTAHFVDGSTPKPLWIADPKVFWDRRELRWVKVWDVDVQAALSATTGLDSIFYFFSPPDINTLDKGNKLSYLLHAFRLINASPLRRNVSIVSGNPIYLQGDFNAPGTACQPADYSGVVPDSLKYCNAMIASDAFTLLSPNWPLNNYVSQGMNGTLEQPFTNPNWTDGINSEPITGYTDAYPIGQITVNAAILTGNKQTDPQWLAVGTPDGIFNGNYEGGWNNTIRFLENFNETAIVKFKGSFVCLWPASTIGLKVLYSDRAFNTQYFVPPKRAWGFDPRFSNINNMPPGAPFLSSDIYTNWSERQ